MKRCSLLVIVILTSLLLFACSSANEPQQQSSENSISATQGNAISTTQDNAIATTQEISISATAWNGYTGYSDNKKNYQFLHSYGRNHRWEEIIVQIADSYLSPYSGHPFLSDRDVLYLILDEEYGIADMTKNINVFNENKQKIFISNIDALISSIGAMTDTEIMFSLAKTIFEMCESHTTIGIPLLNTYPLAFMVLHNNSQPRIYCSAAPKEHSDLTGCELVSINQVPIAKVLELFSPYSHSFDEHSMVTDLVYNTFLNNWEALQMLGIIGIEDETVEIELEDAYGKRIKASFEKVSSYDFMAWYNSNNKASIYDKYPKQYHRSRSEKLWYEMIDDHTLYLRISTFDLDMGMFPYNVKNFVKETEGITTLILDLRDNGGGYAEHAIYKSIRDMNLNKIFVLTNSSTQSASITSAQALRRFCQNVTVIGSYGWHTNFLGSPRRKLVTDVPGYKQFEYILPHSAVKTSASTDSFSKNAELFTPDVFLYYEYKDFIEGKDTFLEWIKNQ